MIRFRHLSLAVSVALCSVAAQAHAEDLLQVYGEARASDPQLAGAEASRACKTAASGNAGKASTPSAFVKRGSRPPQVATKRRRADTNSPCA